MWRGINQTLRGVVMSDGTTQNYELLTHMRKTKILMMQFKIHFLLFPITLLLNAHRIQLNNAFSPTIYSSTLINEHTLHNRQQQHVPLSRRLSITPQQKSLFPCTTTYKSNHSTTLKSTSNDDNDKSNKASVALSSTIKPQNLSSPTAVIDYALSILTSDIGSIIIGSIGLLLALYNRLSTIDFDSSSVSATYAESINIQSRNDLLAVFASGAVLLNGISKLDVTSVLAESVTLYGVKVDGPLFVNQEENPFDQTKEKEKDLQWAMEAVLSATPAKTAVLLVSVGTLTDKQRKSSWVPIMVSGIMPSSPESKPLLIPDTVGTPILDRFLKQDNAKESYLPTLQALPGKVEFTYLPENTQEALLVPIKIYDEQDEDIVFALALGSDTAKSFTPRDVAWCQVLARRLGDIMSS